MGLVHTARTGKGVCGPDNTCVDNMPNVLVQLTQRKAYVTNPSIN